MKSRKKTIEILSKTDNKRRCKKKLALFCLCFCAAFILLPLLLLRFLPWKELDSFLERQYSSRFYDRNGELLYILSLEEGLRREWTDLEKIPQELLHTFIEAEDRNFYKHFGIDIKALFRAVFQNAAAGERVSGASTITMQLARMVKPRLSNPVKISVKVYEMINAIRLELKLSKRRILELYINSVPFGFQTEGVTSASRNFYNKSLSELNKDEMNILSLLPRSPSSYAHLLNNTRAYAYPHKAPHFIQWVLSQKKTLKFETDVYVSLDYQLNEKVLSEIRRKVIEYKDARISSGSAFAIDNNTGEILVWVGNHDFDNPQTGYVDGVLAKNQSGSTMKPFLYALALENGFAPNSVLPDVPMDFGSQNVYVPQNFNNRYNGPQLFRTCLASSLNIPAVYLLYRIGVDQFFSTLLSLGFNSLEDTREQSGLSLALGSGEVTLFELVRAFSVFPRDGILPSLTYEKSSYPAEVVKTVFLKDTARIICSMLSDAKARALGFGNARVFDTSYSSLFKTGTANQFQDIAALGATPSYTAGAWMGNISGETIISETGSSIPASIVRTILDELEKTKPSVQSFKEPESYKKGKICAVSGMRAGALCRNILDEYVLNGPDSVLDVCTWHYEKDGLIDVQYPDEFQRWFSGRNMAGSLSYTKNLRFLYPLEGSVFMHDQGVSGDAQRLRIEAAGGSGELADLFDNGEKIGTSERPFSWFIQLVPGMHTLSVQTEYEDAQIVIEIR